MLDNYRRVLAIPGARMFSATGCLARLPISMFGLGIVLLISDATGSYGLAGSVSAAYLIANAGCAILLGRLVDRLGQAVVLAVSVTVCSAGVLLTMLAVSADWPLAATYALAALAGASLPPVGSCIRARWSYVAQDGRDVQTAYALEGVVDEAVFVLGPILVTMLATTLHPLAGLGFATAAGLAGTLALVAQPRTAPPPRGPVDRGDSTVTMPWRPVVMLAAVCLMLGTFFGSAEVATVAFAEQLHAKPYAGVLLALWAFGSLSAGVVTGAVQWRISPTTRLRRGAIALTCVMAPLFLVDSLPIMGMALFVAGFAVAPTLIATLTLAEQVVPKARLTEGMAVIHTGIVAGVAPGATVAGIVIDHAGAPPAYLVAVAAGGLAALLALLLPTPPEPPLPG